MRITSIKHCWTGVECQPTRVVMPTGRGGIGVGNGRIVRMPSRSWLSTSDFFKRAMRSLEASADK